MVCGQRGGRLVNPTLAGVFHRQLTSALPRRKMQAGNWGWLTATAILQRIAGEDLSSLSFLSILIPEYKLKLPLFFVAHVFYPVLCRGHLSYFFLLLLDVQVFPALQLYFTKSRAVQKRSQWEGGKLIRFSHNTPHNTGRCFLPLGHCGPKDAS